MKKGSNKIINTQNYILIYFFDRGIYLTHIRPIVTKMFDRGIYLTHIRPIVPYCTIYYVKKRTINVFDRTSIDTQYPVLEYRTKLAEPAGSPTT